MIEIECFGDISNNEDRGILMSLLSENQIEEFKLEVRVEQLEPISSSEVERNSQFRIYQNAGQFYAVEVAVPSGWFMSIERIKEEDIPKYTN